MSAQIDAITNKLDALAFGIGGADFIDLEKFAFILDKLFKFSAKIIDGAISNVINKNWMYLDI